MKPETRVIGIDDSPFDKFHDKTSLIVATFYRGGRFLDGVLSTTVQVDGTDSTDKIIAMVRKSKFYVQLQAVLLDGIAVAGFNVIDVCRLSDALKLPIIVVMRDYPDFEKIERTLVKLKMKDKIELLRKAGPIHKIGKIHIQCAGIPVDKAKEIIKLTTTHAEIPEPLRVAHIIASGIIKGESRGKA